MTAACYTTKIQANPDARDFAMTLLLRRLAHGERVRTTYIEHLAMLQLVQNHFAVCVEEGVYVATDLALELARREAAERLDARVLVPHLPCRRKPRMAPAPRLKVPEQGEVFSYARDLAAAGLPVFAGELSDPPDPHEARGISSPELTAWYVRRVTAANGWKE